MKMFLTRDNTKLHYFDEGKGTPIVFVHGWSGSLEQFMFQIEPLKSEYRTIAFTHRGHGFSERPDGGYTLPNLAQDLNDLLNHLNLDKVVICGWSMGAMTLYEYVKQFGCDRLKGAISIDMTPKLVNDDGWTMGLYDGEYSHEDFVNDLTTMFDNFLNFQGVFLFKALPYLTPELAKEMQDQILLSGVPPASMLALTGLWNGMAVVDYRESIAGITCPFQIIRGKQKSLYSRETADYFANKIPGTKIVEIDGTHMCPLEKPQEVTDAIRDFMKSLK